MIFEPWYLVMIVPAILLALVAELLIQVIYASVARRTAGTSGYAAARALLDAHRLQQVPIEQIPGKLTDHYDPRLRVLRLSTEVYHGRSLSAVGVAAYALRHALPRPNPLVVAFQHMAVATASSGSNAGFLLIVLGIVFRTQPLLLAGMVIFGAVAIVQLANVPLELAAGARAGNELVSRGLVRADETSDIRRVLNAVAFASVATMVESLVAPIYFVTRLWSIPEPDDPDE